jgi:hypothetical protein
VPLLDRFAKDIVGLALDTRFEVLMKYWRELESQVQREINSTDTEPNKREVLVCLRDWIDREVLSLVPRAQKALEKQEV